jgi:KipI family sensor histidine kinase inhibitor
VEVPVRYDGEDLPEVARLTGLEPEEVVRRHTAPLYTVAFLGFSPGFPYLVGLDPALAVPRRDSPRTSIPAGSVGLAGDQTGIYPTASPGGWRLIGRTEVILFDPGRDPPALLGPGDRLRFTVAL